MLSKMNQFESRINALRLKYKAERIEIQRASNRRIGHLNTAIGQVTSPEAREALWAEKARIKEATRQSMAYNRMQYRQHLEAINDESRAYFTAHPSRSAVRRSLRMIYLHTTQAGKSALHLSFGDRRHAIVAFA
jgi:hypothetical protein